MPDHTDRPRLVRVVDDRGRVVAVVDERLLDEAANLAPIMAEFLEQLEQEVDAMSCDRGPCCLERDHNGPCL